MNLESWLLFASIAFMTSLIPGPAVFLATVNSIAYGFKNSLMTIAGNVTGLFVMSAFSILGLSTIIIYSTPLFMSIKFLGAGYLIYLGIKLWFQGFGIKTSSSTEQTQSKSIIKLYMHGLFVALSNPKGILFTTALFPQFLDQAQPIVPQFLILVITFMITSFSCLTGYAYIAAKAKNKTKSFKKSNFISKIFGAAFITSGLFLANVSPK